MGFLKWFKKPNRQADKEISAEVSATKEATRDAFNAAQEANEKLAKLLEANHFTVHIFNAVGGNIKPKGEPHGR